MTENLPYMVSPSVIPKILEKMQNARRPERFTQDFLETILGFTSSSARPIIPLLKRIGLLNADGTPTKLYDQFRNPDTQGQAVAQAIRSGYKELYDRNEYVHAMPRDKLSALVIEMTGVEKDNRAAQAIVSTFWTLKELADFESPYSASDENTTSKPPLKIPEEPRGQNNGQANLPPMETRQLGFNVAYTINLNLPETTNPEVFNAIFRALREHLLK